MSSGLGPTAPRRLLLDMWQAGLQAVDPRRAVADFLRREPPAFSVDWVLAVGKAADGMLRGVLDILPTPAHGGIAVLPRTQIPAAVERAAGIEYLPGDHPLAGAASIAAGQAVCGAIDALPPGAGVLVLLSGGASALLELPAPGWSLDELRQIQAGLLGSGLDIAAMNAVRGRLSQFKYGGLARRLGPRPGEVLLISDVPGDAPATIGSGPLVGGVSPPLPDILPVSLPRPLPAPGPSDVPYFPHHVIARNADFLTAAAKLAVDRGVAVQQRAGELGGDAIVAGRQLAKRLRESAPGLYLWGGETTVRLAESPGRGGRNQNLALAAAEALAGTRGITLLAAGTDGIDGNTEDAGAIVDGETVGRLELAGIDPRAALAAADAGTALAAAGEVLHTGPSGTNVMDVVMAIRDAEKSV